MSDAAFASVAVTLSVAPALEERVGDWLLEQGGTAAFTGRATYSHRADGRDLTVAEQVSGRQRRVEFTVVLSAPALGDWLAALRATFAAADVDYVVTPVIGVGTLRDPA